MFVSVIIPTYKGAHFLPQVLKSLKAQSFKDFEVIIIVKPSGDETEGIARKICKQFDLQHRILIQTEGHFTRALNMGIKGSKGDILLFTDDDVILPKNWVKSHIYNHIRFMKSGAISGQYINIAPTSGLVSSFKKESLSSKVSRGLRWRLPLLMIDKPHPLFKKYRLGIYITQSFRVAKGFYIPHKLCFSLPCRGVNMSFKRDAIKNIFFPEHPLLKIAPYNEQYLGARIVLEGWESIYDPQIVVYHRVRQGLSASTNNIERRIMSKLFEALLKEYQL